MTSEAHAQVIVLGAGPAGLLIAAACVHEGLSVQIVAADEALPWPNNYGIWLDELSPWADRLGPLEPLLAAQWKQAAVRLDADRAHVIDRAYARLDNAALKARLLADLPAPRIARATGLSTLDGGLEVTLAEGAPAKTGASTTLQASVIIDATGHTGAFTAYRPGAEPGFQAAVGRFLKVPEHPFGLDQVGLMDFSPLPGASDDPVTFAYVMPFDAHHVFVEETSLVGRPAVDFDLLDARLDQRLAHLEVPPGQILEVERCLIPMGAPLPDPGGLALPFGGAARMVHPASGYMIHQAFARAPVLAAALARGFARGDSPAALRRAGWQALWPRAQRRLWSLFTFGMEVLLTLDAEGTRAFFDAFFSTPEARWKPYLSGTASVSEAAGLMTRVFGKVPGGLKARLVGHGLSPRGLKMLGALTGLSG